MSVMRLLGYSLLMMATLATSPGQTSQTQSPSNEPPLSVEEVVRLIHSGLPEDVVIAKLKKNGKAFDLSTEELVELKKEGVSDTVIKFLLDPSQTYTPPPSPGPQKPTRHYPDDAQASKVPPEPGVYFFSEGLPVPIDTEIMLGQKVGGKKGDTVAYLIGPAAKKRIKQSASVFYMRLPEGKAIEEVILVSLDRRQNRRELNLGKESKEDIRPSAVRQLDRVEVGAQLFRVTAAKLTPGEYLFFLIGSATPAQGNYGKGYDFGVD